MRKGTTVKRGRSLDLQKKLSYSNDTLCLSLSPSLSLSLPPPPLSPSSPLLLWSGFFQGVVGKAGEDRGVKISSIYQTWLVTPEERRATQTLPREAFDWPGLVMWHFLANHCDQGYSSWQWYQELQEEVEGQFISGRGCCPQRERAGKGDKNNRC